MAVDKRGAVASGDPAHKGWTVWRDGYYGRPPRRRALEAHINWLRHRLAYRTQSLRNQPRSNQLLRLMVAGRNGQADERAWAERIRQHLIANDGQAPRQRQLVGAGGL